MLRSSSSGVTPVAVSAVLGALAIALGAFLAV
jgi:hypothetical protein